MLTWSFKQSSVLNHKLITSSRCLFSTSSNELTVVYNRLDIPNLNRKILIFKQRVLSFTSTEWSFNFRVTLYNF